MAGAVVSTVISQKEGYGIETSGSPGLLCVEVSKSSVSVLALSGSPGMHLGDR